MLVAAKKFSNLDCKKSWFLVQASCSAFLCSVSSLTSRSSFLRSTEENISICLSCISSSRWRGEAPSSSSHTLLHVLRVRFLLVASSAAVGFAAVLFRTTAANGTSSSSDSLTCCLSSSWRPGVEHSEAGVPACSTPGMVITALVPKTSSTRTIHRAVAGSLVVLLGLSVLHFQIAQLVPALLHAFLRTSLVDLSQYFLPSLCIACAFNMRQIFLPRTN